MSRLKVFIIVVGLSLTPQLSLAQAPASQSPAGQPAAVGKEAAKPTAAFLPSLFHNLADDIKHLPRKDSVYWLAAGGGLALAVHPADDDINAHLEDAPAGLFKAGKVIGATPTILGAGAVAYIIGRWKHHPRLQHLGLDEIEGAILSAGIVEGAKQVVRRDRPLNEDGSKQSGFSFPSGHAATTFTAATILQQHLGYKAGIPTYLVTSYVAVSRLADNRHFASDVAFGAFTGIVIGRTVAWHGRNFYGTPVLQKDTVGFAFTMR